MAKILDLKGQRFGKLIVLSDPILKPRHDGRNKSWFLCQCDCGNQKEISGSLLKRGEAISCSCHQKVSNYKHGHAANKGKSRTYDCWVNMKGRCSNPNDTGYSRYGAKGITYDPAWEDFEVFLADMGECADGLEIDRLDPKGNYCKKNCRWATEEVQSNNKTTSHYITFNGKTKTVTQWAKELNIHPATLFGRLQRGWDEVRALTEPVKKSKAA